MKTIIIIGAVVISAIAGYLFRSAISSCAKEEIFFSEPDQLILIPNYIKNTFAISIFLFVMAVAVLEITMKGPY